MTATGFRPIGIYSPVPQSGKSTTAKYLKYFYRAEIVPLASPVKGLGIEFLMNFGYSREEAEDLCFNRKEFIIPQINKSVRYILQTIGTEWGRNCIKQSLWVDIMLEKIKLKNRAVIDDVRFPNEADAIKSVGGLMWKVIRPSLSLCEAHASEGALDSYEFDCVIFNDGSINELYRQIDQLISNAW